MAREWRSVDGRVWRRIDSVRSDCVGEIQRPVCEGDLCSVRVVEVRGEGVCGWLAEPAGEGCVLLRVGLACTWLDRLLEQCLLSLSVGDRVTAEFSRPAGLLSCRLTVESACGGSAPELLSADQLVSAAEESGALAGTLYCSREADLQDAFCQYRRCLRLLLLAEQRVLGSRRCQEGGQQEGQEGGGQLSALAEKINVCRANICACLSRSGHHQSAVDAASRVLAVKNGHVRCLYRRAVGLLHLQRLPQARADITHMLQLEPGNTAALKLLRQWQLRQQEADAVTAGFMRRYMDAL